VTLVGAARPFEPENPMTTDSLSLDALIGAQTSDLEARYRAGSPPERAWLGERVRGRMLAAPSPAIVQTLARPVFVPYAKYLAPWEGKSFSPDGRFGANRVLGQDLGRFRCDVEPSIIDGQPTLRLDYDLAGQPWPVRRLFDELRQVSASIAIGVGCLRAPLGRNLIVFWFGVEAAQ
jgi:hypothetical protein